ncbi:glycosyltransferase [Tautonia plasticadhaerens]|uniref:Undecaprenyl-phosphate mannosyltransferase n=1 Tax=Tautonia plasticadhaerens TaxID=2527974 RepID=A0A518GWP5_9BACT|nr:glycosyltransferase [Tautonia plasticadhaerens]QDV33017.1 Undecaprenyl-phosphate mannosyltransferase [Tautonia plasticadhaerens]
MEDLSDPAPTPGPAVAVAIPCFNEAAAIGAVVDEWRGGLPGAEVVVFDNNSTDGSGPIASGRGARVVPVPEQGKGHVVRRMFAELADRDAVVMIDGDGTYPASAVGPLLSPVLEGRADLAVGVRRPEGGPGSKAMSPIRGVGNAFIGLAFRVLVGPGTSDLLSGYRVFGRSAMRAMRLSSSGFEIETELAGEAIGRGLRVVEAPVPYRPRIPGSSSKLRALRDGCRILEMILRLGVRLRPWRLLLLLSAGLAVAGVASGSDAPWIAAVLFFLAAVLSAAVTLARREAIGGAP